MLICIYHYFDKSRSRSDKEYSLIYMYNRSRVEGRLAGLECTDKFLNKFMVTGVVLIQIKFVDRIDFNHSGISG